MSAVPRRFGVDADAAGKAAAGADGGAVLPEPAAYEASLDDLAISQRLQAT